MSEALQEANVKLREAVEARLAAKAAAACCEGGRCHPKAVDTVGPLLDVDHEIAEDDDRTPESPFGQTSGMSMEQMEAAWAGVKARVSSMQERIREPSACEPEAATQSSSGDPGAETLLSEVLEIVRDRRAKYGPPEEHFARTVGAINAIFAHKLREPLTLGDWAQIMILDKIARHQEKPQRDNQADTAGYAGCWAEVEMGT